MSVRVRILTQVCLILNPCLSFKWTKTISITPFTFRKILIPLALQNLPRGRVLCGSCGQKCWIQEEKSERRSSLLRPGGPAQLSLGSYSVGGPSRGLAQSNA